MTLQSFDPEVSRSSLFASKYNANNSRRVRAFHRLFLNAPTHDTGLDQHIFIPMPDTDARASIFKACLRKAQVEDGIAFDKLAAATEGYTGADLNSICQKAVKLAVRERIMLDQAKEEKDQGDEGVEEQEPKPIVINDRHLEAGFKATPPSVSKRDILFYQMQAQETAAKTGGKASMLAKDDMSEVTGRYLIK